MITTPLLRAIQRWRDRQRRSSDAEETLAWGGELPPPPARVHGRLTTDHADPRLTHGVDDAPVPQAAAYLVLSEDERARGFVRPVRRKYIHLTCGSVTTMGQAIAETYARDPKFYGATYCVHCGLHRPVGEQGEFIWDDASGERVGT